MVGARNFQISGVRPTPVESVTVEIGEWLPDLPDLNNPGAIEALNVIPSEGAYVPFKDIVPYAGVTASSRVMGAVQMFDVFGAPHLYVGTVNGVYRRVSSTLVNVYTPTVSPLYDRNYWQFIQFGNSIVGLHGQLAPVVADVGGVSVFSPLAGSPPIARCGARVGDFLVLGNLSGEADPDGPRKPRRIRWSGFNNIEAPWVTDPATQADFNDMPSEGGDVVAITGREYGTVFQERCISRMTYTGLPNVFDIQTVEEERGAISTNSVVDIGAFVFFIAQDGFFMWNGTNTTPISDNKVTRYFFSKLNYAARDLIVGAVDLVNKCIVWAYPTGAGTTLNELLIYSYKENRFSRSNKVVEWIMNGYTLDSSLDDMTGDLEVDYPISFDSDEYAGRRPYFAGFDATHTFGVFNGAALAATADTAVFTGPQGTRVDVNNTRPLVDVSATVATVQPISADQLIGGALVYGDITAQEITGECPVMASGRYIRFRIAIPAGAAWKHLRGIEISRKAVGRR